MVFYDWYVLERATRVELGAHRGEARRNLASTHPAGTSSAKCAATVRPCSCSGPCRFLQTTCCVL
jgi:hypothetical protein